MSPTMPPVNYVPRGLVVAAALAVLVTLIGVTTVRLSGAPIRSPDAGTLASRSLRFEDRVDGSVAVIDAQDGRELERVQGEAGFLRGALRAMARERRQRGLGSEAPFSLVARTDGRLTLLDPATDERIDLESFGPTNAATFARLLTLPNPNPKATAPRTSP